MPSETMMRVFKLQDESGVSTYPVRDSHINIAYGECQTTAETVAKVVTLTNDPGWKLRAGSFVIVHFTNAVPANATLNVAETGAHSIYLKNQAATAVILAGDIVTFIYDGTNYIVTAIDRVVSDINNKLNISQKGVWEYNSRSDFPATGESDKIYIAKDTNKIFRWNSAASSYVTIGGDSEGSSALRKIPFIITTSDWVLGNDIYSASVVDVRFTADSEEIVMYDESMENLVGNIIVDKNVQGNSMVFTVSDVPEGTISGTIYSLIPEFIIADGKVDVYQGSSHAGKVLKVNSSGNLELATDSSDLPLSVVDGKLCITYLKEVDD